jgi:hypothetical protein
MARLKSLFTTSISGREIPTSIVDGDKYVAYWPEERDLPTSFRTTNEAHCVAFTSKLDRVLLCFHFTSFLLLIAAGHQLAWHGARGGASLFSIDKVAFPPPVIAAVVP